MNTFKQVPPQELLVNIKRIQQQMPMYLLEAGQKYGDLVLLGQGKFSAYFVNHPEAIQHVLQDNHKNYTKNTIQYNQLRKITGNGLLTNDGDTWLKHRRVLQPAFTRQRLMALIPLVNELMPPLVDRWKKAADTGELINIDQEMMELALEIVSRSMFGMGIAGETKKLTGAVITALDHLIDRVRNPMQLPDPFPTRANLLNRSAMQTLDEACYRIIRSAEGAQLSDDNLLAMLLHAHQDPALDFGEAQTRDEVITILIAGHETVASALTWTWYLLSQNPAYFEKAAFEIQSVLGNRPPEEADYEKLILTGQIFDEALRLYPPAWVISRRSIDSDSVMGVEIPANALVIMSPYVVHRHSEFWEDPETFLPERFSPETEKKHPRYAYIPFGGGPRLCIGYQFALIEARIILAHLLSQFRVKLPADVQVQVDPLVTLRPRHGLWMQVEHA